VDEPRLQGAAIHARARAGAPVGVVAQDDCGNRGRETLDARRRGGASFDERARAKVADSLVAQTIHNKNGICAAEVPELDHAAIDAPALVVALRLVLSLKRDPNMVAVVKWRPRESLVT